MYFALQQDKQIPVVPPHVVNELARGGNLSRISIGASPTFSLASFSRGCYIAAMSDGQSGETREDGALLRGVAARDREAFRELYARYHVMLFSLALRSELYARYHVMLFSLAL